MLTNGCYEDDLDATSPPCQLHGRGLIVPLPKDEVNRREPRNKLNLTMEPLWTLVHCKGGVKDPRTDIGSRGLNATEPSCFVKVEVAFLFNRLNRSKGIHLHSTTSNIIGNFVEGLVLLCSPVFVL